ncbi:SMP-30/gluconolactonase/LRE family protein [Aridibaculum aurantiacum]|uniref:SMP-30/gluconolactonase/LRE family protein n=1 Tax=Aridibaculum aurantiacum TaxID=2810307 RepID=UPI001A97AFBD|nr:SMP-30/gluconolactonase/LRE family protein [Aridibaculum aurantiacum]
MKNMLLLYILSFSMACGANKPTPKAATTSLVADGATLQLVSDQFKFTEGPAKDAAGNVFFTDQPNNRIWKYNTDGQLSIFMENAGRSNGLYFNTKGQLLACADGNNELWRISMDKSVQVLVKDVSGEKLNGPNDVWENASNGDIYFTDPYYKRDYWTRTEPARPQHVYLLRGGKLTTVATDLVKPNGIIGTADGKRLYIADIGDNKTYTYTIEKNGSLSNKKLLAAQGSDGMTLDERGNVYLTGKGVMIYNAQGEHLQTITVPENWTANVCFGGVNNNQLFITASKSAYTLLMNVKGQ